MPIRAELRPLYRTPEYKAAREACRERAKDRCEQCGGENGAIGYRRRTDGKFVAVYAPQSLTPLALWPEKARMVEIQCGAAHLNNAAGDDRPENLAWLCRGCHLHRDAPFHKETRATRKDAGRPLLQVAMLTADQTMRSDYFKIGQEWRTANGRLLRLESIMGGARMRGRFLDTGKTVWLDEDGSCRNRPYWDLIHFAGPTDALAPRKDLERPLLVMADRLEEGATCAPRGQL